MFLLGAGGLDVAHLVGPGILLGMRRRLVICRLSLTM